MKYLLFTLPNCAGCESLKKTLNKSDLPGEAFNLVKPEGKKKLREYIKDVKRDDKGAVVVPTLLMLEGEKVEMVINSSGEFETWLKSRD
jgi:glutaredoxin